MYSATFKGKIDSLQYLRGFAAIWVLLTHCFQRLSIAPFGYTFSGQYGVDIFFLLSGFIIYYTTKDGADWKAFAVKRILRIFPLYWFCLILYSYYYNSEYSIISLLQNVFMIPCTDAIGFKSLVVRQAWSTCYELYFYFLFSIILAFSIKKNKLPFILFFVFLVSNIFRKLGVLDETGTGRYILSLTGNIGIILFVIGIIISNLINRISTRILNKYQWGVIVLALLFSLFVLTKYNWFYSIIWATVTFISWLFINRTVIKYENKNFNKFFVWLGDI